MYPVEVARPFRGVSAADRRARRRDLLLEAGLSALADGPLAAVTVEDICARAGLSKRYFYEHFRTRNDLFVAVAERLVAQMTAAVAVTAPKAEPLHRLKAAVVAAVSVLIEDPGNTRALLDLNFSDQLADTVRRTEHAVAEMIVNATVGDLPVTDAQRTRLDLAALICTVGSARAIGDWLDGTIELSQAELVDEIVRSAAASIAAILS